MFIITIIFIFFALLLKKKLKYNIRERDIHDDVDVVVVVDVVLS